MKKFTILILLALAHFGIAQPTTSAPEPPTRNASDVISVYGSVYTNIADVNFDPNWGQSGHGLVDPNFDPGDGNLVLAYPNFNYQGTDFASNPQNGSAMEYLHIDIWTANATVVQVTPIDNSGVGPTEVLVEVPLNSGSWNSVDLPKDAFVDMSWNSIFQLKFDGQAGTNPSDIYLDNIYFWKTGTAQGTDATLSDLQLDGATIAGFTPSAFDYRIGIESGASIPQITMATTTDVDATVDYMTQANTVDDTARVGVIAADGMTTAEYSISFFYSAPAVGAPNPTEPDTSVISLFSDVYTDVNIDTWNTSWSQAVYEEVEIDGNPTKKYTSLGFNGIEATSNPIDASGMDKFKMHVWTPNMTQIKVKLVDFLGDGFGGANGDTEAEIAFDLIQAGWNEVSIPLADFANAGMTSSTDINQLIITSEPFGAGTAFIDNVYFAKSGVVVSDDASLSDLQIDGATIPGFVSSTLTYDFGIPTGAAIPQITMATPTDAGAMVDYINQATAVPGSATVGVIASDGATTSEYVVNFFYDAPADAAPTPTKDASLVLSMFSDAYNDVTVDTWNTSWSQAVYEEVEIDGNPTKKYTSLGFNGVETISSPMDLTEFDKLHIHLWTPNMTQFKVKLVDFLGDGFGGANGDTEAQLVRDVAQGSWNELVIPLTEFDNAGLTSRADINQFIFDSEPFGLGIAFIDNVYFSKIGASTTAVLDEDALRLTPTHMTVGQVIELTQDVERFEVYNMNGQLISQGNEQRIDTRDMQVGIYFASLYNDENQVRAARFIID